MTDSRTQELSSKRLSGLLNEEFSSRKSKGCMFDVSSLGNDSFNRSVIYFQHFKGQVLLGVLGYRFCSNWQVLGLHGKWKV